MISFGTKVRYYAPFTVHATALALLGYLILHFAGQRQVLATTAFSISFMLFLYMTICHVVQKNQELRRIKRVLSQAKLLRKS